MVSRISFAVGLVVRSPGGLPKALLSLYSFPIAAIRNYHKLWGLIQHRFITIEFRRLEV